MPNSINILIKTIPNPITALSDSLQYIERKDIKFDFPDCEACFIEIVCAHENINPIFGALYRHPGRNARLFNTYIGEFLEMFTERKTKLTILGDININLNKANVVSNEYMTTLTSAGFNTLINQPTRLYHYEGLNTVTCSTLDHLITNCGNSFCKTGIIIADVSDHLPIFGLMKISKPCNNTLKNSFKRLFPVEKKDNFVKALKANLDKVDLNSLDPNYLMDKILLATKDAIDQNFPYKKVTRKEAKLILKAIGGGKGPKNYFLICYSPHFTEFNGFYLMSKFQVLFEISRSTFGVFAHFRP